MTDDAITVAITGASGVCYAFRLLQRLLQAKKVVHLLISETAKVVIKQETHYDLPEQGEDIRRFLCAQFQASERKLRVYDRYDWTAPMASGSGCPRQMVVCPCSCSTLSAIATGASGNLIERAADVVLKERCQLLLVPRETPFSVIQLEHMLSLSRLGAVVLPACPGFYHQPESLEDLIDFIVARILTHLGIKQNIQPVWGA